MEFKKMEAVRNYINGTNPRSAWEKGVKLYALDIIADVIERSEYEGHEPETMEELTDYMLNGAKDYRKPYSESAAWIVYSEGGSALIYDGDICDRLATASEQKRTNHGEKDPNPRESWLQVQGRALYQAANHIKYAFQIAERKEA